MLRKRPVMRGLVVCLVLVLNVISVRAQTINWNKATGDWSTASNWDLNRLPTSSDSVYIANGRTANITQSGEVGFQLLLGDGTGSGAVIMSSGSLSLQSLYAGYADVGSTSIGYFTQSGGTFTVSSNLDLGHRTSLGTSVSGTYTMTGGVLSAASATETVGYGYYGKGYFIHSGGTNNVSTLTIGTYGEGTYTLSGNGIINAANVNVSTAYGKGTFNQTGGTNNVSGNLNLGDSVSSGTYNLSGSGQLSAANEYLKNLSTFSQSGGLNSTPCLSIASGSTYLLSGGILQLNGIGISNQGTIDTGNSSATLSGDNCILDFTSGTWKNLGALSVSMGAKSLVILPAGTDTTNYFNSYVSSGFTHVMGDTLTVPAGRSFSGWATINDPVVCQGTITAPSGGSINLNNGLTLSDSGTVNLSTSGNLMVNDTQSQMSGGSLILGKMLIGKSGTGVFTQSGGTISASNYFYLGYNASDNGSYALSGTGQLHCSVYVGYSGTGTFTQSGGNFQNNYLYIGYNTGSIGTYNMTGGQLTTPSACQVVIGQSGTGYFNHSGGTCNIYDLFLGGDVGAQGTYTLSDSGNLNPGIPGMAWETIGTCGTGTFKQLGGNNYVYSLSIGAYQGGNGIYELSGGQLVCSSTEFIGERGTGTFRQTGGSHTFSGTNGSLTLGKQSSLGTYYLSGGQLTVGYEYLGYSYNGVGIINQSGGTNTVGTLSLGIGTYNLEGGTLIVKTINKGTGTVNFNFGGGTLQANGALSTSVPMTLTGIGGDANVDTAGNPVTLSGALTGPGGLNKLGANTLTLSAVNSYNGATTITAGTLALSGTGKLGSTSVINVGSGAAFDVSVLSGGFTLGSSQTLIGSGTVVGNLTILGTHAPGNSPGIETIQGNYSMQGQLQVELMGTAAGTNYDQVLLNGSTHNATLGGSLTLDWTSMNGSTNTSELWILRNDTAGSLTGTFNNYANGSYLGNHDGHDWYLWYGADATTGYLSGGNDVVIAAVPEPSTIALILMAGLMLGIRSTRRKKVCYAENTLHLST